MILFLKTAPKQSAELLHSAPKCRKFGVLSTMKTHVLDECFIQTRVTVLGVMPQSRNTH
jgi:hypothetical protein